MVLSIGIRNHGYDFNSTKFPIVSHLTADDSQLNRSLQTKRILLI